MRLLIASLASLLVAAQRGSPFRCRDRDPQCASWKARGECGNNHDFMAENCPQSCEYCENGGLFPTPSPFQLDLVCQDQLATNELKYKGYPSDDLPDSCAFRCRDNFTAAICEKAVAAGQCEDKATAATVRFQCPESCGICKFFQLSYPADKPMYPKASCREETASGNSAEHEGSCGAWAEQGECVSNFGFMSLACEASCGLCEVGAAKTKTAAQINAPPPAPRKPKGSKKKKKKKTVLTEVGAFGETSGGEGGGGGEAAAATEAAEPAASAEPAAAKEEAPAEAEEGGKKKKKGWAQKAKEAVKSTFSKKKAEAKDEV